MHEYKKVKKPALFNPDSLGYVKPDPDPASHRKAQAAKQKGFKGGSFDHPAKYFPKRPVKQAH